LPKSCSPKPDFPKSYSPKPETPYPDSSKSYSPKPVSPKSYSPKPNLDLDSQLQLCLNLINKIRKQIAENEKQLVSFQKRCPEVTVEEEEVIQLEIVKLDIQNELLKQDLDFNLDHAEVLTQKLGYFDQEEIPTENQFQKDLVRVSETKVNICSMTL
jgi:hypothetical protein